MYLGLSCASLSAGARRYPHSEVDGPRRSDRVAAVTSATRRPRAGSAGRSTRTMGRLVVGGLVVCALVLLTLSYRSPTGRVLHDAQTSGATVLRPFQVAAERIARPFRNAYNYLSGLSSARSDAEKARREVRQWRAQALVNLAATKENASLKRLLHFEQGATYPKDFRSINTSVIAFASGPFGEHVTIDAGADAGVVLNAPVVTPDGLLGHVTTLGAHTSSVVLLTDANSAVAARDLRTKTRGLIQRGVGDALTLANVRKEAKIKKGDMIVTDGTRDARYPDLYPFGIPIGQVTAAVSSDIASFQSVQVSPFTQFGSLDVVAVLIPTKSTSPKR